MSSTDPTRETSTTEHVEEAATQSIESTQSTESTNEVQSTESKQPDQSNDASSTTTTTATSESMPDVASLTMNPPSRARSASRHDISNLTTEQRTKLSEMKTKVQALEPSDNATEYTYLRFLRARKFVVDDAVAQYTASLKWRAAARVDSILDNPPTQLRKLLGAIVPESFHKFDKFGLPAYFLKAGRINPSLLLKYVTVDDMITTHLWGQEYSFQRAEEKSRELGHNIDQFVNILDLQGLSMGHHAALKYMKVIAALDQQYYPESLGKTFVINAPWIFPTIWNLVKGWLDPVTVSKIHVLGSDYADVLKDRFESCDLPSEYGGTCQCPGGCVPEHSEAEVERVVQEIEDSLNLESITLAPSQSHVKQLTVGPNGATVHSYFRSYKADIGFAATYTNQSTNQTINLCKHAKFSHGQPHKHRFAVKEPGTITITFDNKHSWRHTETFKYAVKQIDEAVILFEHDSHH